MPKIVVLTDIHIRPDQVPGKPDPDLQLRKGIDHINRFNGDADLVVFCGDLADEGDVGSYEILRETLKTLTVPHRLLLGNHDNRENFLSVFSDVELDPAGFVQQVFDFPDIRLIFLDTLFAPPYKYPLSHAGFLCEQRLAWLDEQLGLAEGKACVIFMHHPPHETGFVAMDTIKLNNEEAFYEVVLRNGNVKHVVCGHVHRTISGSHRGIPFSVFKSPVGQMPMLFDVMDFHMETNEPAAYGIISISYDSVLVQTEDYELTDLDALRASLQRG